MSTEDYDNYTTSLNKKAKAEYDEWIKTLSKDQLDILKKNGGIEFSSDKQKVGGQNPNQKQDAAESNRASHTPDLALQIDKPHEILAEQFDLSLATATAIQEWHSEQLEQQSTIHQSFIIQRVVGGLLSSNNPKLSAAGLAFATELDAINGIPSQSVYAEQCNISRSTVSKSVLYWQEVLGIKKGVHQKSAAACKKYSEIGKSKHWRKRKATASEILKKLRNNK